jgi:hypothetical protein
MLRWIEASVSCSNLFMVVTCEHADSASSSTRLQVMGGDEEPRELGKYSSDTPGPKVHEDSGPHSQKRKHQYR